MFQVLQPETAKKIALVIQENAPKDSKEQKTATNVVKALSPRIYIFLKRKEQNSSAEKLEKLLEENDWIVPAIQMKPTHSPAQSDFRYFKKSEKKIAETIYAEIKKIYPDVRIRYIENHENSTKIRANHFELWL